MPAIDIFPFSIFISRLAVSSSITGPQAHSSSGKNAIINAASMLCESESKCCVVREGPYASTLLGVEPNPQSPPIAHWDGLLRPIGILVVALVVMGPVVYGLRRVHRTKFGHGGVSVAESGPLLGTRAPSSTTLHSNNQNCQSVATTTARNPTRSLRGSIKPVLRPVHVIYSDPILEEYRSYVASPVENTSFLLEPPTTMVMQLPDSAARGRVSAVIQKVEPISSDYFDPGTEESQAHKPNKFQTSKVFINRTQNAAPSIAPPSPVNEARAQTAPCLKFRSASLVKSLTDLASIQQATVHALAVGMSWAGIGDGSRALPGPLHDIEWLRNMFSLQSNFRFNSLIDHAVSLATIRQSLECMLSAAGENDLLALYFTGHGGDNDSFELYDSTLLTEVMLNEWIVHFRSTTSRNNPVYIIFDFCRPDCVKPSTEFANGVNVIWACSPTESALELRLNDPNNHLPRSCFLLSLVLAIGDVSEDPAGPIIQRFTTRMKEFVQLIRGLDCLKHKCQIPWRICGCETCSKGKLCIHDKHHGNLPFQVVSVGGIEMNSNVLAVVKYIADRFPLHIKRAVDRVSKNFWVLYFNPSRISPTKRPLNPRNHRLGTNAGVEANTARNMSTPAELIRF
ncbi:unnamed protein product [Rhizoctonia solani]|uniref:Peptidase C14 caspase domain-containing protein n=1 Tax=Rhizoctonia solani TaxID=456999 RepID=A0A8H3E1A5_9AGAM|nr:unnamed protein product [Rhizoctonia solani]